MKTIVISIHSFVDLITNSSTEIYIAASDHTIDGIKRIINNILAMSGSNKSADDFFEFSLGEARECGPNGSQTRRDIIVTAKKDEKNCGAETAKLLSNLTSLFSISAEYDG